MTIEYSVEEKDFVNFQLFTASKSDVIRKRRFRAKVFPTIMYIFLGTVLYFYGRSDLTIIFAIITVVWFFMYPLRERRQYKMSYEKHIRTNYKDKFGNQAELIFDKKSMTSKDQINTTKIPLTDLAQVTEIPNLLLIKLKSGQTFILPKDKVQNIEQVKLYLKDLTDHLKIQYVHDYNWAWK